MICDDYATHKDSTLISDVASVLTLQWRTSCVSLRPRRKAQGTFQIAFGSALVWCTVAGRDRGVGRSSLIDL